MPEKKPPSPKPLAPKPRPAAKAAPPAKRPATRRPRAASEPAGETHSSSEPPLSILMVTSEAHPFAKTGGLAEVAGALPPALARLGHEVTLVLPRYRGTQAPGAKAVEHTFVLGGQEVQVTFLETTLEGGGSAVLVDNPALFDRPGLYNEHGRDYPDNAWRFAVLSRSALEYARLKG